LAVVSERERAAKQYAVEEGEGVGGEKSGGRRGEGTGRTTASSMTRRDGEIGSEAKETRDAI
jgi:hypothetical protein